MSSLDGILFMRYNMAVSAAIGIATITPKFGPRQMMAPQPSSRNYPYCHRIRPWPRPENHRK